MANATTKRRRGIPNRIKEFRELSRLTQQQLADMTDMSQPNLHRIENSDISTSLEQEIRIARALGQEPAAVFPEGLNTALLKNPDASTPKNLRERWMFHFSFGRYRDFVVVESQARAVIAERLNSRDREGFIVFNTGTMKCALSLAALKYNSMTLISEDEEGGRDGPLPAVKASVGRHAVGCVFIGDEYETPYEVEGPGASESLRMFFDTLADDRRPRAEFLTGAEDFGTICLTKDKLALVKAPLAAFARNDV